MKTVHRIMVVILYGLLVILGAIIVKGIFQSIYNHLVDKDKKNGEVEAVAEPGVFAGTGTVNQVHA